MQIAVEYEPVEYLLDWGVWYCQHVGDTYTLTQTITSVNLAGEPYEYNETQERCRECRTALNIL